MATVVGRRIREVCQILEDGGPCTSRELCDRMMIEISNAGKYGNRAAGLGMVSVERGRNNVFTVIPGWRDIADRNRTTKIRTERPMAAPMAAPKVSKWHGVSSVFQMGGL
jgi:hypothetical protein